MKRQGLDLQQFSRSTSLTPVGRVGSVASVRNLPTVQDVGTQAEVQMLSQMADDSSRLANIADNQFQKELSTVKKIQALEEEGRYADFSVDLQQAVTEAKLGAQSTDDIIPSVEVAYDTVYQKHYGKDAVISDFQKQYIQNKLDVTQGQTMKDAYGYQMKARAVDAENAFQKVMNASVITVMNQPELLDLQLKALDDPNNKDSISSLMDGVIDEATQREVIGNARSNLYKAAASSYLDKSPSTVIALLKTDEYKNNINPEVYAALKKDAKVKIASDENERIAAVKRQQDIATNIDLDRLSRGELEPDRASMYTYANAEEKYRNGEYNKTTYNQVVSTLDKINNKKDEKVNLVDYGMSLKGNLSKVYDTEDKKAIDAAYNFEMGQAKIEYADNPKAQLDASINIGTEYTLKTGYPPKDFIKPIKVGLSQGDPNSIFVANEYKARLEKGGQMTSPFSTEELGVLAAAQQVAALYPGNDDKSRQERTRALQDRLRQSPGRDIAKKQIKEAIGTNRAEYMNALFASTNRSYYLWGTGSTFQDKGLSLEQQSILMDEVEGKAIDLMASGNLTPSEALDMSMEEVGKKIKPADMNDEKWMVYGPSNPFKAGSLWMKEQMRDAAINLPEITDKDSYRQKLENGDIKLKIRINPTTAQTWVNSGGMGASYTLVQEDRNGVIISAIPDFRFDYDKAIKDTVSYKGNYRKNREYIRRKYVHNPMKINPAAANLLLTDDASLYNKMTRDELDKLVDKATIKYNHEKK